MAFLLSLVYFLFISKSSPTIPEIIYETFHEEYILIQSFTKGCNTYDFNLFQIRHPTCYRCKAKSRYLTAFTTATYINTGASLPAALFIQSLIHLYSAFYLILMFSSSYSNNTCVALFVMITMVFLSPPLFTQLGKRSVRKFQFRNILLSQNNWRFPISELLGKPGLAICLASASSIFFLITKSLSKESLIYIGVLIGLLPSVESRCFYGILITYISYILISFYTHSLNFAVNAIQISGTSIIVSGIVPFLTMLSGDVSPKFLNWTYYPKAFFSGWWNNLGPLPFVLLLMPIFFLRKDQIHLYLSTVPTFLIQTFVTFGEYHRDHFFILYPTWILVGLTSLYTLSFQITQTLKSEELRGVIKGVTIVIFGCSIITGILYLTLVRPHELYDNEDLLVADFLLNNTKPSDIIITPYFNYNPVTSITGRRAFVQEPAIMWKYGFYWHFYQKEMNELHSNPRTILYPKVRLAVEHVSKDVEHHIFEPVESGAWILVYESLKYRVYNCTLAMRYTHEQP